MSEDKFDLVCEILDVYKVIFTNWQSFSIDQRMDFYERFKKIEALIK